MKKLKEEKGITLVALIITIVVLLILAAVAIGTVRDSNIIAHAQNAAGSYNQSKENEIGMLSKYEQKIESIIGKERKYAGQGITIIWKANNVIDVYQSGELLFSNIQAKEISKPSDGEWPDECSRFFEITAGGEIIRSALYKDESVLVIEGVGELKEVKENKGEYPIAYSTNGNIIIIEISKTEAIFKMFDGIHQIVEVNDINKIEGHENDTVVNNYGIKYTKVIVCNTDGNGEYVPAVYCAGNDTWYLVTRSFNSDTGTTQTIREHDITMSLDTTTSKEELEQMIQEEREKMNNSSN